MTTYARCNFAVTDDTGIVQDGCSIRVELEEQGFALRQLFADTEGETILGNPFTAADGGDAGFYCEAGFYKVTATKSGFERIWRHVPVGTAQGFDFVNGTFYQNVSVRPDAFVDLIADRATYNGEAAGFSVVVLSDSTNQNLPTLYAKLTSASGDWSDGITWAPPSDGVVKVRLVAEVNVALASGLENGDTIDGVTLVTGNLVLLTAQSTPSQNGVYRVVASGTASRSDQFVTYDKIAGNFFSVMEGATRADTLWRCTSNFGGTIDSTSLVIAVVPVGGDVVGPLSVTDSRPALFDGTTGKLLKQHSALLGTAAIKNTGTGIDNVVLLDGAAKIPAVDASQVTGLTGAQGAGMVFLQAFTANSDAQVDLETGIGGTYDHYRIFIDNVVPTTDDADFSVRFKIGGSYLSGASDYSWIIGASSSGTPTGAGDVSDSQILLAFINANAGHGNASGESGHYVIDFGRPTQTSFFQTIDFRGSYEAASGVHIPIFGVGRYNGLAALQGIRFFYNTGLVAAGTFRLYGFRNA